MSAIITDNSRSLFILDSIRNFDQSKIEWTCFTSSIYV